MFTVVDIGYFERRSGSNWIVLSLLGAIELSDFCCQGFVGGLRGLDVRFTIGIALLARALGYWEVRSPI